MQIKKIAHIGLAVKDVDEASKVFTQMLPLKVDSKEAVGELSTGFVPVGEVNLELVMSTTENGVINKHIAKRGEGVHHIAFEVDDVFAACQELKDKGVPLTTEQPYDGAHGAKVLFIHPKVTHGILIELCQYPEGH